MPHSHQHFVLHPCVVERRINEPWNKNIESSYWRFWSQWSQTLHYFTLFFYLVCVLGFHRCVSGLGGGLHVDSGSSQVCGGGRGRLPAQPVPSDWSDGGHGGHLHQPRYGEARVKPSHDPGRPGLRLKITYSIIRTPIYTSAGIPAA